MKHFRNVRPSLQIPIHPSGMKKKAFITPFGLFKFLRMPSGLKNTSMTFQRYMDRCLQAFLLYWFILLTS